MWVMAARARHMSVMRRRCGWLVGTFVEWRVWAAELMWVVLALMFVVGMEMAAVAVAVVVAAVGKVTVWVRLTLLAKLLEVAVAPIWCV